MRLTSYMIARSLVLCSVVVCALSAADPGLNQIRTVYLLPMSGGLDQYLANKLTREGRFQVVTDPARAEAVFTDRLGSDFESRMTELYPPPPTPEELERQKKAAEEQPRDARDSSIGEALGEVAGGGAGRISSFSRGKGNIFLVDRESRQVIWSYYQRPRSSAPTEMDRTAGDIAGKLHDDAKKVLKAAAQADKKAIESMNTAPVAAPAPQAQPAAPAPAPQPVAPQAAPQPAPTQPAPAPAAAPAKK